MNNLLASLIVGLQTLSALLGMQAHRIPNDLHKHTTINIPQNRQVESHIQYRYIGDTLNVINQKVKNTVVNLVCLGGKRMSGATGTGVIISKDGTILTNAHLAQYFLLQDYTDAGIKCQVRTGSPAKARYTAHVVYMPNEWVNSNAYQIIHEEQFGTGKDDYALLQISGKYTDTPAMPDEFPFSQVDASGQYVVPGSRVLARAYPAELVGPATAMRELHAVSTTATIKNVSTFSNKNKTADLFSLGGSIIAQGGSSGGGVFDKNGKLIGIIVTTTKAKSTAERTLRALSMRYINESFHKENKLSLDAFLNLPLNIKKLLYKELLKTQAVKFVDIINN